MQIYARMFQSFRPPLSESIYFHLFDPPRWERLWLWHQVDAINFDFLWSKHLDSGGTFFIHMHFQIQNIDFT